MGWDWVGLDGIGSDWMGWDGMGRGMAAQIGFHLFEYARHFLTCCKRILGLNEGDSNNRGKRAPVVVSWCVSCVCRGCLRLRGRGFVLNSSSVLAPCSVELSRSQVCLGLLTSKVP